MHTRPTQTLAFHSAISASTDTETRVEAAILQTSSCGFVSSALFLIFGVLCDRWHSRVVKVYRWLTQTIFKIRRISG